MVSPSPLPSLFLPAWLLRHFYRTAASSLSFSSLVYLSACAFTSSLWINCVWKKKSEIVLFLSLLQPIISPSSWMNNCPNSFRKTFPNSHLGQSGSIMGSLLRNVNCSWLDMWGWTFCSHWMRTDVYRSRDLSTWQISALTGVLTAQFWSLCSHWHY